MITNALQPSKIYDTSVPIFDLCKSSIIKPPGIIDIQIAYQGNAFQKTDHEKVIKGKDKNKNIQTIANLQKKKRIMNTWVMLRL